MSAKHTPGPWFCDKDANDSLWIVGDPTTWVPRIAKVPAYFDMPNEANARLIAAAPDLLAALQRIEAINTSGIRNPHMSIIGTVKDIARAAIARAEGSSHA